MKFAGGDLIESKKSSYDISEKSVRDLERISEYLLQQQIMWCQVWFDPDSQLVH